MFSLKVIHSKFPVGSLQYNECVLNTLKEVTAQYEAMVAEQKNKKKRRRSSKG